MIVFQVVFCVLAMVGLVTVFMAGRYVQAAVTVRRIREHAAIDEATHEAIREVIIQQELAIWDSVPPELLPDLITHTPEDFDD